MAKFSTATIVPAPWGSIAVACRKCGKKLDGGFGPDGDEKLSRVVRTALRAAGRRRDLRIIESACLGLCPKGAVTVIRADRPNEFVVLPAGTPEAEILARLLP